MKIFFLTVGGKNNSISVQLNAALDERLTQMTEELHKIRHGLNRIAALQQESKDEINSEWILAAIVVERLCFITFTVGIIVFTAFFFIYGFSTQDHNYIEYTNRI